MIINPRFSFFLLYSRRKISLRPIDPEPRKFAREYTQVSSKRLDFDTKITEVELTIFAMLSKSSPFIENVDERRQIAGFHLTPPNEDAFFLRRGLIPLNQENQLGFLSLSLFKEIRFSKILVLDPIH